jgi:transposase-like protein
MLELLLSGVSTRDYQKVIREMADTVGVSKSSVSREFVEESATKLQELNERSLLGQELLIIYLDGMVYGEHHVLGAVGIDREGFKHALGMRLGSSENAVVVKDLLADLVARGLNPEVMRLFVIDGSKALRKAVKGSVWRAGRGPTLSHAQTAQRAFLSATAFAEANRGRDPSGLQAAV